MIKRKKGVKAITIMVIVLIMFIISAVPVCAANYFNEASVLDDFVVQVKNASDEAYNVTVKIMYQDENGDTLYVKKVTNKVDAFETTTIDAKDYYNSENTQKVIGEIVGEENVKEKNLTLYLFTVAAVCFVLFIIFLVVSNHVEKYNLWGSIAIVFIAVAILLALIGLAVGIGAYTY